MKREKQEKAIRPNSEPHNARNRTSVIDFFRLIWLASLAMVSMGALAAETPQMVGTFVRSDGVAVSALVRDLDGVVGFIGYTCWFDLSDGTKIYPRKLPYGKKEVAWSGHRAQGPIFAAFLFAQGHSV